MSARLLAWYDVHARTLPWRVPPQRSKAGQRPDPYHIWLSEVMLQQTTIASVIPHYTAFLARWPNVQALAAAQEEEVLAQWAGLGYYTRARKLIACARQVVDAFAGQFPADEAQLLTLPGIGPYTAAAVVAIAFSRPAVVVDGNVERVMARIHALETPLPAAKPFIKAQAAHLTPLQRAGDYAQAVMDLGATVCSPKKPACGLCPWQQDCAAHHGGREADFPKKLQKKQRPTRYGTAFVALCGAHILLRRRPASGLLASMVEVPSTPWDLQKEALTPEKRDEFAPLAAQWQVLPQGIVHIFTHFRLEMAVCTAQTKDFDAAPADAWWQPLSQLDTAGLPSVMRKIVIAALRQKH